VEGTIEGIYASPNGGVRKPPIEKATLLVGYGIEGDASAKHRRTPQRALCLYSTELYAQLNAEGLPLKGGDLAENLLLRGIDFAAIQIGDWFAVGDEALIEISEVRVPCSTLTPLDRRLPKALVGRSGFLAYVRKGGEIRLGDSVRRVQRAEGSSEETNPIAP